MPKKFVLVHGCHLDVPNWEAVIWGDPMNGIYGRVPTALRICDGGGDMVLQIGAGGSAFEGLSEGEWTLKYLQAHLEEVRHLLHSSAAFWETYLRNSIFLETEASNTPAEILAAFTYCIHAGIQEVVLVSSPEHIMRCLRDALQLREEHDVFQHIRVCAQASDVSVAGTNASDVVIIEPPHKGGLLKTDIHQQAKRLIPFMKSKIASDFCFELDAFLTEQEKKL